MTSADFLQIVENFQAEPGLTIWRLGGPSIAIQTPQALIYLDLFTGLNPACGLRKATEDIIDPNKIRKVDAVLSTHHDLDHCHEDTLKKIHSNTGAFFIGPISCHKLYREWSFTPERTIEVSPHKGFQLKDLHITAMPSNDYFDADAVTYIFQSGGVTAFDGGDTLFYAGYREFAKQFDIDVALLNFAKNPPDEIYYMNHAHVARTAEELGAKKVIPKHYDLWEEFLDDPAPLIPMLEPKNIQVIILKQGEHVVIRSRKKACQAS